MTDHACKGDDCGRCQAAIDARMYPDGAYEDRADKAGRTADWHFPRGPYSPGRND